MKSPIKYPGGKSKLWNKIIPHFPIGNYVFVDPYVGGGSILLNAPYERRIASDINIQLISMWCMIRDRPNELVSKLSTLQYANHTLQNHAEKPCEYSEYIIRRMSRGGEGTDFAWSNRTRGGNAGDFNAWLNSIKYIPIVSENILRVTFLCRNAVDLIKGCDSKTTFFYLDPPYLHDTRVSKWLYRKYEMSEYDHEHLNMILNNITGKACISGYRSKQYDLWYADWRRVDIPTTTQALNNRQNRVECIWMNY